MVAYFTESIPSDILLEGWSEPNLLENHLEEPIGDNVYGYRMIGFTHENLLVGKLPPNELNQKLDSWAAYRSEGQAQYNKHLWSGVSIEDFTRCIESTGGEILWGDMAAMTETKCSYDTSEENPFISFEKVLFVSGLDWVKHNCFEGSIILNISFPDYWSEEESELLVEKLTREYSTDFFCFKVHIALIISLNGSVLLDCKIFQPDYKWICDLHDSASIGYFTEKDDEYIQTFLLKVITKCIELAKGELK